MTDTRHPDIEIYVKNRSLDLLCEWILQYASAIETLQSKGNIHELRATINGDSVELMIHEKVAGKLWASVWFKSDKTPWAKDLDCAHAAAKDMDTQVRCIASGWQDGDDPDEWWKIENGSQEQIQWLS